MFIVIYLQLCISFHQHFFALESTSEHVKPKKILGENPQTPRTGARYTLLFLVIRSILMLHICILYCRPFPFPALLVTPPPGPNTTVSSLFLVIHSILMLHICNLYCRPSPLPALWVTPRPKYHCEFTVPSDPFKTKYTIKFSMLY